MRNPAPRVLAILPNLIPSTVITIVKPLVQLHRAGRVDARIALEWLATPRDVRRADLVVFCRNIRPRYASLLEAATNRGIPVVYDLDDNFFELPPDPDSGRHYLTPERRAMLNRYLGGASLVRVYSEPLRARAATVNRRVVKMFAPVDAGLIAPDRQRPQRKRIAIVYATSRAQDHLYQTFMPALRRVLQDYAGRVEAHFWGYKPPGLGALRGARHQPPMRSYDRFVRRFRRAGFEIGLAPLLDDPFHRSKTNNKFREYGACRIAGIYSDVDVYSSCVTDAETGLLVSNEPDAWYRAMVRLIENPELRAGIQDRAWAYVRTHHCPQRFAEAFWTQIRELLDGRTGVRPERSGPAPPRQSPPPSPGGKRPRQVAHAMVSGVRYLFAYARRRGPRTTLHAVRWTCADLWMLAKYRHRLRTAVPDRRAGLRSDGAWWPRRRHATRGSSQLD